MEKKRDSGACHGPHGRYNGGEARGNVPWLQSHTKPNQMKDTLYTLRASFETIEGTPLGAVRVQARFGDDVPMADIDDDLIAAAYDKMQARLDASSMRHGVNLPGLDFEMLDSPVYAEEVKEE